MQPQILEEFQNSIDDPLLKQLLTAFIQSLNLPEDKQITQLIQQLKESFKEQGNAAV